MHALQHSIVINDILPAYRRSIIPRLHSRGCRSGLPDTASSKIRCHWIPAFHHTASVVRYTSCRRTPSAAASLRILRSAVPSPSPFSPVPAPPHYFQVPDLRWSCNNTTARCAAEYYSAHSTLLYNVRCCSLDRRIHRNALAE